MSHIAENKTIVKRVNESVLQETLELIARITPGIKIDKQVQNDYRGTRDVDCAVHTPDVPGGLGMDWKGGELKWVGDSYGIEEEYTALQKLILTTYQTVACRRALESMNYTPSIASESVDRVRLEAVYA